MSFVMCGLLGLIGLAQSRYIETTAPRTTFATTTSNSRADAVPRVTDAALAKRAKTIPPNICGWYSGSAYDVGWSDAETPSATCFWNTDEHLVGTGSPLPTTCLEHATSGGDSTLKCADDYPYCLTFLYGHDYSAFLCHSERDVTWTMAPTWSGLDTPIAFPIYSGSDGISTGTQYPSGYDSTTTTSSTDESSTSETSSSSSDSSSESPTSTATGSTTTSSPEPISTPTESSSSSSAAAAPAGAIAGGVVGGLAVIGIVACVIIFLLRRKRNAPSSPGPQTPTHPELERKPPAGDDEPPKPISPPIIENELQSHEVQELESREQPPTSVAYQERQLTAVAYQEMWAPCAGPDSTQGSAPLVGGRQIHEAP